MNICLLSLCSGENHTGSLVLSFQEDGYSTCQDGLGEDLACSAQKGDPTIIVVAGFVTFAFV